MIRIPTPLYLLLCGGLTLALFQTSCEKSSKECPPCPNNTRCIDGDCGCAPDQHDMGNWCLYKHDNLFVSASLDCPCLEVQGLVLQDIQPQTEVGSGPKSTYALSQPDNIYSGAPANFYYYQRPDGDSIALFNLRGPGPVGFYSCPMNDSLYCEIDMFGKFHGADTIQTTVLYTRCRTQTDPGNNHQETRHLTFVRLK
ncbi:MAG: hypothetical protein H7246_14375 [Phycisphaerae bacterium]|nr:hypothetical protein [Saprospiraceae bacterium]